MPPALLFFFKLYYNIVVIKTVWYWHKNRHVDQWNRLENPEVDPQLYGELIFDKVGKISNRKHSIQQMVLGKLGYFITPYTKINSKCMKELNVRQENIKILEENTGSNLCFLTIAIATSYQVYLLRQGKRSKNELLGLNQIKTSSQSRK